MSKTKLKYKDHETAYIKAIKKVMREEVGFIPKIKEPNKQKGENKNGKEKGGKQKPKK
jgi:hypothetical protein